MPGAHVQTGGKEHVGALVVDASGAVLSLLSNLFVRVRRLSDNYFFDWSDDTFKTLGLVTQLLQAMSEPDATGNPGFYHLDTASHPDGEFDTSAIANHVDGDTYVFTMTQEGAPQNAANVPQTADLKVGGWLDLIDQAVSGNATPAEVQDELRAIRLHQLVAVNPGAVQPSAGTYIKQLLDGQGQDDTHKVLQNYSYDPVAAVLQGSIWVEADNLVVAAPVSVSVVWVDASTEAVLFTVTDAVPDARGFFYVSQTNPGLAQNKAYYALATVTLAGAVQVQGAKGSFTF